MPSPSPEIVELLSVFAIAFTAPTWKNGLVLLFGAILAPGRRTVTSALRVMGLEDYPRFEKYHRVLNRNRWQPLLLSKLLLGLIIGLCVPAGMPLLLAVDETLERRWGPKINYLGVFRDPVRSTKKKVVYAWGVRWLTMALVIPVPWAKRQWALPFLSVALLSPKTSAKLGKRHRTSVARAGRLLSQVRRWHPEREIVVVGDGAFAAVPLIQHCQRKHIQVTLVSRLRLDMPDCLTPPPSSPRANRAQNRKKATANPNSTNVCKTPRPSGSRCNSIGMGVKNAPSKLQPAHRFGIAWDWTQYRSAGSWFVVLMILNSNPWLCSVLTRILAPKTSSSASFCVGTLK